MSLQEPLVRAKFVGQPFHENTNLYDFLTGAIADSELHELTLVTAWAKRSGLTRIASELREFHDRGGQSLICVGIDEGGATKQGLELARALFSRTFVLHDPGRRTFHPKLYVAKGDRSAEVFVGSNNMTAGGLYFNYEAASRVFLDRSSEEDEQYLAEVESYVAALIGEDEICLELDDELFEHLLSNGGRYRIGDEDDARRRDRHGEEPEDMDQHAEAEDSRFGRASKSKRSDPNPPSGGRSSSTRSHAGAPNTLVGPPGRSGATVPGFQPSMAGIAKRWTKRLGSIDAQQSGGSQDWHASNTLTLVKGPHPVDTQTYFRDNLFADESWTATTSRGGKPRETTTITCEVIVNGDSWGDYEFELRHTPDYDSNQSNRATELVWGGLGAYLRANSHVDDFVSIEKLSDGSYRLHLGPAPAGPFVD